MIKVFIKTPKGYQVGLSDETLDSILGGGRLDVEDQEYIAKCVNEVTGLPALVEETVIRIVGDW